MEKQETQDWLRLELTAIEAIEPSTKNRLGAGWRTRRAQMLIAVTMRRWAPLAAKLRVTPDEVATAALDAWSQAAFTIPADHDAWAWTGNAVKRIVGGEQQAALLLTTPGGRNVRAGADAPIPVRFDPTDREMLNISDGDVARPTTEEPALLIAALFLARAGLSEPDAWRLIDALTTTVLGSDFETRDGRPTGVTGRKSAVTTLQRERSRIATEMDAEPDLVSLLIRLIFGSREKGGLLEMRSDGATVTDLVAYADAFRSKNGKKLPTSA